MGVFPSGGGGEFSSIHREVCDDSSKEDSHVGGEERKGRGLHDDDMINDGRDMVAK